MKTWDPSHPACPSLLSTRKFTGGKVVEPKLQNQRGKIIPGKRKVVFHKKNSPTWNRFVVLLIPGGFQSVSVNFANPGRVV